ncbi:HAE1 family hydrophobic/amphiphilic exporter-1 [Microcella alkaliphila]|uniref:HAE1 family hydrophobic/amphiphilic exporter-1 n=1 Tax=Microcella alkaliphila TaxID=279828 RepID=A0A4Q7TNG4_9MICO|nr:efflux RND transporter permease subunit [Microcella alkaliphila]RZT60872.1 HAE1 family hydrophobic/amphiphilic exporter-1 [Microcella alkaliphila]
MFQLSAFSLRNRALIALVTIVVGVFGGLALTSLKQELIPSIAFPQVLIISQYPGAAPDAVEQDVSTPIENAIQAVDGLEASDATSSTGFSTVTAQFTFGTDIARAEQRVQLAVNRLDLPSSADVQVITGSIDDLPVVQVGVTSGLSEGELAAALDVQAVPELTDIEGVREVSVFGAVGDRVEVTVDDDALAERGLTRSDIVDALDAYGVLLPAGTITENDRTLAVLTGVRIESVDALAAVPLLADEPEVTAEGTLVVTTIDDVADVAIVSNPVDNLSRINGEPALTLGITKTPDGNTVDVSRAVQNALPAIAAAIGSGTEFTVVFDQAPFIESSIEALAIEGSLGLVFAVIVILVFLLSVRSTLVTAVAIPTSILLTFIGMQVADYSINILTLGAITISIGRVVDDSIVVVENIKRHMGLGEERMEAIQNGVREVATAITSSTLITIAVFLPLALVGDITGELFRPFALTTAIALGASLFTALTIVPVLSYWFLRRPKAGSHAPAKTFEEESANPTPLQRGYLPALRFSVRRPVATLLLALLVLGGTGALATQLQTNFIGDSGQNTLTVRQSVDTAASLDRLDEAATVVEETLFEIDGIETVQASIGQGGGIFGFLGRGSDITYSITTDESADQVALQQEVRDRLFALEGVGDITVRSADQGFASSTIDVEIFAPNQEALREAAQDVLDAVSDLEVTAEASSNLSETQPYIAIEVDRVAAAEVGLTEAAIGGLVAQAMFPAPVGDVVINDTTLDIFLPNDDAPVTISELRDFTLPTATGPLALSEVAVVEEALGPESITTMRGIRSATVSITPSTQDIGSASAVLAAALDDIELPDGARAELGGVAAQQADAFQQLGLALLVALLITYVILVATFKSLRQPLLLLVSVPFAATGAILLQVIADIPLGVPSLVGVLMLIGIVVTNAIVLIDLVNQYREGGMTVRQAVIEGSVRRLRPVLMTAAATIFALVPLGLGITGTAGFISQPLAVVVIGGLVSSTLLTLVVLPALYWLVEGARERRDEKRAAREAAVLAAERATTSD